MANDSCEFDYDVCFSFAGEQRIYVEQVAEVLRQRGIRVFYDAFEQVSLWGKDLYEHLTSVYRDRGRYCVVFVSKEYAAKQWPSHERKSAQARAIRASAEYILPARFDDTELPGLNPTIAYVDLRRLSPAAFAELLQAKLETSEAKLRTYHGSAGSLAHTNAVTTPNGFSLVDTPILPSRPAHLQGCAIAALITLNVLTSYLACAVIFYLAAGADLFGQQMRYNWQHPSKLMVTEPSYYTSLLFVVAAIVLAVTLLRRSITMVGHALISFAVTAGFVTMMRSMYSTMPDSPIAPHLDAICAKVILWSFVVLSFGRLESI